MNKSIAVGQVLDGRYRVERLLGEGGMGAVYEGFHVVLAKRVALKMLHPEYATSEEVLKRFYREAQAASTIGHKNTIEIYDVGVTPENAPYIAMEYLEGEDLESLLVREGRVSVDAAAGVLEPVLLALAAAHSKGIIHRDLKPSNIFITRDAGGNPIVKLIDFGISKITKGDGTKLTQTGSLIGTPAYMSPEQARGMQNVDHRTDLYAVGVIMYQLLTGTLPFTGANYSELIITVLTSDPKPPRELVSSIPQEVNDLVIQQLSKDPQKRSQSAAALLQSLLHLTDFDQRNSGMSSLATRISQQVAGGDIGKERDEGHQSSASKVLQQFMRKTPGGWARTTSNRNNGPWMALGMGGALLVVAMVAFGYFVLANREPAAGTVPLSSPPPVALAADKGVQIEIVGLPKNAQVLFNGAPVLVNPFRVPRAETLHPLVVRLEGHEPFSVSVMPNEDLRIEAKLVPLAQNPKVDTKQASASSRKEQERSRSAKRKARTEESGKAGQASARGTANNKRIAEGRKGTQFSESFE
ncbi:MAG: protein kinase [Myxococcota bacterium]|jgi:serine/threonine protein kinase|nr:protein kinase [Myxococcota bacterium]